MSARIRLASPDTATRPPFRVMCALWLALVTQLTFGAAPARAHAGGHGPSASPLHRWVDPATGGAVTASVLFVEAGHVLVETEKGSIVAWPIERLRAADRLHVGEHVLRTTFLNVRVTPPLQIAPRTEWTPFLLFMVMVACGSLVLFYRGGVRGAAPLAWRSAAVALLITVPLACGGSSPGSPSTPTSPSPVTPSPAPTPTPSPGTSNAAVLASYFAPFSSVRTRSDSQYLYVESDGMANHTMMVGIRSWQQQVPLPMAYTGSNAFAIPIEPRFADSPVSLRTALFKGAVALAINGVPIFNALKRVNWTTSADTRGARMTTTTTSRRRTCRQPQERASR